MESYALIYRGPSSRDDPRKAKAIAEAMAARWPLSAQEAFRRLEKTPFALRSGLSKDLATLYKDYLAGFGAEVEIISSEVEKLVPPLGKEALPVEPERRWYVRHAWRGFLTVMASGFLLSSVIVIAGFVLTLFAGDMRFVGLPKELLRALGWTMVALGLLVFLGALALRLRTLLQIAVYPNLSTPLETTRSFLEAINEKNWGKAMRCLAARPESSDLGLLPRKEAISYMRQLAAEVVLPRAIDPVSLSIIYEEGGAIAMSFRVDVISKHAAGGGSRLLRSFVDTKRFQRHGDEWFLVDGHFAGQSDPARLPLPACLECGEENILKQNRCPECGESSPPVYLVSEEWLPARRRPEIAALLSALVPGMGQAYNGQPVKGFLVAATCWLILPWAAGVIDALRVAERINRSRSYHDLPSRPALPVYIHLGLFASVAVLASIYLPGLRLGEQLFNAGASSSVSDVWEERIFREPEGRYSISVPRGWRTKELRGEGGRPLATIISPRNLATVAVSTKPLPDDWQVGIEAQKAKRGFEKDRQIVSVFKIIVSGGHRGFRINSYSGDGAHRYSFVAIATRDNLIELAFVCPVDRQADLGRDFEFMLDSLEFPSEMED